MSRSDLSRRDFNKLSLAAFQGAAAGMVVAGVTGNLQGAKDDKKKKHPLLTEPHICCGLNTCKGKDKSKKSACAGQGTCHTAKKHDCKGYNVCKGEGGCGSNPGMNACKGKGDCAVPLSEKTWKIARRSNAGETRERDKQRDKRARCCSFSPEREREREINSRAFRSLLCRQSRVSWVCF